jgi:hypothetical protein
MRRVIQVCLFALATRVRGRTDGPPAHAVRGRATSRTNFPAPCPSGTPPLPGTPPAVDGAMDALDAVSKATQLGALVLAIANVNLWNRLNIATRQVVGEHQG